MDGFKLILIVESWMRQPGQHLDFLGVWKNRQEHHGRIERKLFEATGKNKGFIVDLPINNGDLYSIYIYIYGCV